MAWVRPRHPKPKVVDNTEPHKNLLLYFSGRRARPSPPKIDRPVKLDPILQNFAQNKQLATPSSPPKKKQPPTSQKRRRPVQPPQPVAVVVDYESDLDEGVDEIEEEPYVQAPHVQAPPRRIVHQHRYIHAPESVPRPVSPPRIIHNIPRPASPPRYIPKTLPRRAPMERESPQISSWESRSNMSSRWASAVTPLF